MRDNLYLYAKWLKMEKAPARHHEILLKHLQEVEQGKIKRLMIFMPPGSAKSTYASIIFPSWYIGKHSTRNVLAVSHTQQLAERFGRRVRNLTYEENYQSWFGHLVATDSSAAARWSTRQGGNYYAAGAGTAIVGFRADLVCIDDPVAGREQADSQRERERLWAWFKDDCWTRLKPDGAIVLIMQRWHEDDLAGRLLAEAESGGEQWEILKFPMEAESEDDPLDRAVGERLWGEYFTEQQVAQAKRDPRSWLALYQQRPRPESGGEFKREWIECYRDVPDHRRCNLYLVCDPATGKRPENDYTSMWVLGLGRDSNIYVFDMIRDRLNLTERANWIFNLHEKWKPQAVAYEKYGLQSDIDHFQDRMERENYRFRIHPVGGVSKKEDRIRRLIPLYEAGRMWLPREYWRTGSDGISHDLVHEFIEQEYTAFPVGRHDDMLDAQSRLLDLPLRWPGQSDVPFDFGIATSNW